jgi:hypothetical protein
MLEFETHRGRAVGAFKDGGTLVDLATVFSLEVKCTNPLIEGSR